MFLFSLFCFVALTGRSYEALWLARQNSKVGIVCSVGRDAYHLSLLQMLFVDFMSCKRMFVCTTTCNGGGNGDYR